MREALALIDENTVVAAIVDVGLIDGESTAVVERLMESGVLVILQTGIGPPALLIARYPDIIVRIKPNSAETLIAELGRLLGIGGA